MFSQLRIPMSDMLICLSNAIDLVNPSIANHNRQVACLASFIAEEMGVPGEERLDILIAGLLHDIGALSLGERLALLNFDVQNAERHAELGYRHIRSFAPLAGIAPLVRFHHHHYDAPLPATLRDSLVPRGSYIIHLADRIAILMKGDSCVLDQARFIGETIRPGSGRIFHPEAVEAFLGLAGKEHFWLTVSSRAMDTYISRKMEALDVRLDIVAAMQCARLFGRVIDFRSRFTAIHSSRVAMVAESLAGHAGMSPSECAGMKIAGYLHDLGKLVVPAEILDKGEALTQDEWSMMRSHSFHTYHLLEEIEGFEQINRWASSHHERLDGKGYPFHHRGASLSYGDRIVAVADIFTALTEDRPYRPGLSLPDTLRTLRDMADESAIDGDVTQIAHRVSSELEGIRIEAEREVAREYEAFIREA
ncbi:MAG: HD domain-containing protein [Spirochaetes bacterium]|nr:MAG: HD domain-containing protein [Spirochaetota bacterium]